MPEKDSSFFTGKEFQRRQPQKAQKHTKRRASNHWDGSSPLSFL
jgi:hypothetical protein